MATYLDTNTVLFLHSGILDRISFNARRQMEASELLVSPMVLLELEMLHEKGRIRYGAQQILSDLSQQIGLSVCRMPMAMTVMSALAMKWTRDPGDRLITANAHAAGESPLITSDSTVREHYPNVIW